ncbi:hypothetical protein [Burkholderia glumae]|uniref:hypothetical protein n=2 Tax=Burkholderia glumae TaxID=337 RepID=UPI0020B461E5|nr:hypothetical protein [Burkholderia glumae]MCQ0037770.1 hypothetical protein [Burkholderia glumae]
MACRDAAGAGTLPARCVETTNGGQEMSGVEENESATAGASGHKDIAADRLPWEDTLILAFRDMQWSRRIESIMKRSAPGDPAVTGGLEALVLGGPGAIHKLDGAAERLGDLIASNGESTQARFFLLEFKSDRDKRSDEYVKPMLIGAVGRLVTPQQGDAEMIANGDRCHFAVFANLPGMAEPADPVDSADAERAVPAVDPAGDAAADPAGDAPQPRPRHLDSYEQRELLAEPYFDWVKQGVRSVLRELKPDKPDLVDPAVRAEWKRLEGSQQRQALQQFKPRKNKELHKLADLIWGSAEHGLPLPDYRDYVRWLAGLAGGEGGDTRVKLVAVRDGQLYYCLTTIAQLASRLDPPAPGPSSRLKV